MYNSYRMKQLVSLLMTPYEGRSWSQTNQVMVRLWRGCGFAYRFVVPPHLVPQKPPHSEVSRALAQRMTSALHILHCLHTTDELLAPLYSIK